MLSDFKQFDVNRLDIAGLVGLSAFGRALKGEFESQNVEVPEWVEVNLKSLRREIKARNADRIESALRDAKNRLDSLKTPTEKKAELKKTVQALEKQLATA